MLSVGRGGERVCDDGVCVAGLGREKGGVRWMLTVWFDPGLGSIKTGSGL